MCSVYSVDKIRVLNSYDFSKKLLLAEVDDALALAREALDAAGLDQGDLRVHADDLLDLRADLAAEELQLAMTDGGNYDSVLL